MNAIVAHKLVRIQKSYDEAAESLRRLVDDPTVRELVLRLLTSRVLDSATGSLDPKGVANGYDLSDPLSRMHFVCWFVGHEILDDGIPVMAWHKFNLREGCFVACDHNDRKARPFIHHSVDVIPDNSEVVGVELANDILDWHETLKGRLATVQGRLSVLRGGQEVPVQEDPVFALMDDLVDSLR